MAGCKPTIGSQLEISTCIPLCHHTSCGIRLHEILVEDCVKNGWKCIHGFKDIFPLISFRNIFFYRLYGAILLNTCEIWESESSLETGFRNCRSPRDHAFNRTINTVYRMELYNHRFITSQSRKRNQVAIVESMIVSQISHDIITIKHCYN